jgi:hypothetical protein
MKQWCRSDQQVAQAVQKRHVGSRSELQVKVGTGRDASMCARINDDHLRAQWSRFAARIRIHRTGALLSCVVTDQHDAFGLIEVLVRTGRAVGAERLNQRGAASRCRVAYSASEIRLLHIKSRNCSGRDARSYLQRGRRCPAVTAGTAVISLSASKSICKSRWLRFVRNPVADLFGFGACTPGSRAPTA